MKRAFCQCGRTAKQKSNGDWACPHCIEIERQHARQQKKVGQKVKPGSGGLSLMRWDNYWADTEPIAGASLAILERQLATL